MHPERPGMQHQRCKQLFKAPHWHAMLMRCASATGTYPSADTVITTAGFLPHTGTRPVNQYAAQAAAVHGRLGAQQCHGHTQSPDQHAGDAIRGIWPIDLPCGTPQKNQNL